MSLRRLFWTLCLLSTALGIFTLVWAPLNQDEGWYLVAARRVAQGALPYRDFAYTQGPWLPYLHASALPLVDLFGLAGARAHGLLLALLTLGITAYTARRTSGRAAACIAVALLGLNLLHAQYTSTVKGYAISSLAVILGAAAWVRHQRSGSPVPLVFSAMCMSAAAACRISLVLLPLPLFIVLLRKNRREALLFGSVLAATLALAFLPFALAAPEGFRFGLFEFHAGRQAENQLLLRAGFLSRILQSYYAAFLGVGALLMRGESLRHGLGPLAVGIGLVTLLHAMAPFPYDDYQAALYPALVLLLAIELPTGVPRRRHPDLALASAVICLASCLSSPQLQSWFTLRHDRIWWRTRSSPELLRLREVGGLLRTLAPNGEELLTQDVLLAIEARMEVPQGLEMGPFSYFPDLETPRARRLHVLNQETATELLLRSQAPIAALSGYSFSIGSPSIVEENLHITRALCLIIENRYEDIATIPDFGQGATTLRIYRLP